jgi:hypothetical protein
MSVDFNTKVVAAFYVMLDSLTEVDTLTVSNYLLVFDFADTFDSSMLGTWKKEIDLVRNKVCV